MRLALRSLGAIVGALTLFAPGRTQAQEELVALDRVHEFFVNGQARNAARALSAVSVQFRQEIGRCKDEDIGARLIEIEPRLDALVARLNAGTVTSATVLTNEFAVVDQLLAENHVQLAELGWGLRRFGNLEGVGKDLDLAARYVERRARWQGRAMDARTREAVVKARAAAAELLKGPAQAPPGSDQAIAGLASIIRGMN